MKEKIGVRSSPTQCPFCHDACVASDENVVCQECLARHHLACWDEHGACGSCSATSRMEVVQQTPLEESKTKATAEETVSAAEEPARLDESATLFKLAGVFLLLIASLAGTPFSENVKLVIGLLFAATALGLFTAGLRQRARAK